MKRSLTTACALVLTSAALATAPATAQSQPPQFHVFLLPTLSDAQDSVPLALNEPGQVVGYVGLNHVGVVKPIFWAA